jgi:hypothetical protein
LNRTVIVRSTPIRRESKKTDTTSRLSVVKSSRSDSFDIETESFWISAGFHPGLILFFFVDQFRLLAILRLSQSNGVQKGYIQNREIQRDEFQLLEDADGGLSIPEGLVFADSRKTEGHV